MTYKPGYLRLLESGDLHHRIIMLRQHLEKCRLCPRKCEVNRIAGEKGFCGAGVTLEVASSCAHMGEEPVLTGKSGVGNIFLGRCNLRCVFCQNHSISQPEGSVPVSWRKTSEEAAEMLLDFQERGCKTVGLVSPTHYAPQIFEAVALAAEKGLRIPLIYNSSGYDSPELLKTLEGLVDIYLPDFKYWDSDYAEKYSAAADYPETARKAVLEMHRQVGQLRTDSDGVALRGLIIRLLVLPNGISGSEKVLRFIALKIGKDTFVSLMSQYNPMHHAKEYPLLSRKLKPYEYSEIEKVLLSLGFENGWTQDPVASPDNYLPGSDFIL
ncbi:MAG: radical SAM protein [Candidatus Aegiribacteria sp.]|nr:radical SAM protein [Candidatus Aegiribacteria sp.]